MATLQNLYEVSEDDPIAADLYHLKTTLAVLLIERIRMSGWSGIEAAESLKTTPARISNLNKGRIDKFAIGKIIEWLLLTGLTVQIDYNPIRLNATSTISLIPKDD